MGRIGVVFRIILDGRGQDTHGHGIGVGIQDDQGRFLGGVSFRHPTIDYPRQTMIHGDEAGDVGENLLFNKPAGLFGRLPATVSVDKGNDFGGGQLNPAGIRRKRVEPVRDRDQSFGFPAVGVRFPGGQGKNGLIGVGQSVKK